MISLRLCIALMIAGALGTLARFLLTAAIQRSAASAFPWGTLGVNVLGCFAAGFLFSIYASRWPAATEFKTVIMIGFLGAFTTFSTYALESGLLMRGGEWGAAVSNLLLQNGLSVAAVILGLLLGRSL